MSTVSRRRFLAGAGAACAAGVVAPTLRPEIAFAADGVADHTLVVVLLAGGLDGLSALVPVADDSYYRHRRFTAVTQAQAIPVDGRFGLHPALAPLAELWNDGLVAAVPAVGSPTRTRSHFAEVANIAAGTDGRSGDGSGWVARHLLTRQGAPPVTLQAVASGPVAPNEIGGHPGGFYLPDLAHFGIEGWGSDLQASVESSLVAAYAGAIPQLAQASAVTFDALGRLRSAGVEFSDAETDPWTRQLRQVARLVRAGVGVEAAVVTFEGFDTHRDQGAAGGRLANMLDRLARSLATFAADLDDRLHRTTVVVLSEFGRRVEENGSGGTDHGAGGVSFVLGRGVRGGVHGVWPGLDDASLDEGDVPVANDIRSVLAEVVRGRLANGAIDRVFPDFTPTPLGFA